MGWHCHACDRSNPAHEEYCATCQEHWGAVWVKRAQRSGSRTKPKKDKKEKKEKEKTGKESEVNNEETDWQIFPANVPWVMTTPKSRLSLPKPSELSTDLPDVPPAPSLQPPPPSAHTSYRTDQLTGEEQQTMKHLRALRDLGESLPQPLQERLTALEEKEREQGSQKPLTHGHINKLHKLQNQVASQNARIQKLDSEWKDFLKLVQSRMEMHVGMYRSHREDLIATLASKKAELEEAKLQVSLACKSLVEGVPNHQEPTALPAEDQEMSHLAQTFAQAAEVVELSFSEEEMEADMEEGKSQGERKVVKTTKSMKPFIGAGSPNRVANQALKQKGPPKKQSS